mmetsp:Transcript_2176/g.4886  ORF Transcript_2176/g.4886 Transcript_2176/m.4886 type:complete len:238 (-) Transcript_2176:1190-1903(-)
MEALVGIDGTGVILPEGDLPVAPGRHVLDGNGRRPTPALQSQRVLPDGAGRSPPGRHLQVRPVVAILGLAAGVASPAADVALVGGDTADVMVEPGTDLAKRDALWWAGLSLVILAPALDLPVATEAARVGLAGRHLHEGRGTAGGWRIGLAVVVGAPAQDGAAHGLDAADVISAAAQLSEGLVFGRRGDVPPAADLTVDADGAGVGVARGHLGVDAGRGLRLAVAVVPETADRPGLG